MTITDELRKALRHSLSISDYDRLLVIADRIDAEHERECKEQYACGAEHGIGASIEASMLQDRGFIELPKGVDHEYIHEGDKVEWRSHDGVWNEAATVAAVCGDGCYLNLGLVVHVSKFDIRHYHEPTVEDLLREMALACEDAGNAGPEVERIAAEYAKRIRLAGDAE